MTKAQLQRQLGLIPAIALVVGSVIGSSIFAKPATMAQLLPDPMWILGIWLLAGGLSLIGAMINAELGSMFPETGGQFIYFKEMYGHRFAFVYGWSGLAVINTAAVAAIAFVFAQYISYFVDLPRFNPSVEKSFYVPLPMIGRLFPLENIGVKMTAIASVLVLTTFNHFSLKSSNQVQLFFTWLKVILLILIIVIIFSSGQGQWSNLMPTGRVTLSAAAILASVGALSGAFAAFDGWNNLGFVAGELKQPEKQIPRALWIGLLICFILYVGTHLAFFFMLGTDKAAASTLIATDAILPILGNAGAALIAIMVLVSTFGAVNGNTLACARLTFSMGENKDFYPWTGTVHPKYHTPSNALWLHAFVSILYILSGSFDMLADLFVFVTWIFYGFGAYGLIILRKKYPNTPRPYSIKAYPFLPLIFVLFSALYAIITIYSDITAYLKGETPVIKSILGLSIIFYGLILYHWKSKQWASA
ncbi:MAG: amino acid permease [Saprospiraceae bacterium]|nr:amino acid permease [Saprospiraceae bacterium]